jgi:hypothetical protein
VGIGSLAVALALKDSLAARGGGGLALLFLPACV